MCKKKLPQVYISYSPAVSAYCFFVFVFFNHHFLFFISCHGKTKMRLHIRFKTHWSVHVFRLCHSPPVALFSLYHCFTTTSALASGAQRMMDTDVSVVNAVRTSLCSVLTAAETRHFCLGNRHVSTTTLRHFCDRNTATFLTPSKTSLILTFMVYKARLCH